MTSSGCTRWVEFYWDCHKSVLRFGDFTEEGLKRWIIGSREAGISPASVNTRITGINAYLRWSGMSYKLQFCCRCRAAAGCCRAVPLRAPGPSQCRAAHAAAVAGGEVANFKVTGSP